MDVMALLTGDAGQQAANNPMSLLTMMLPIILVFVVFYFFLIRPEKKRKKQITEMRDALRVGDEVVTIGGIIGKITNIKDEQITLETGADRNKIRIMRWAISSPVEKDEEKSDSAKESEKSEDIQEKTKQIEE